MKSFRLDEVCQIVKGKRAKAVEGGQYKVFGAGAEPTKQTDKCNAHRYSIRVTAKGTIGKIYLHNEDFWAEEAALILIPREGLRVMYLYHWLKANEKVIESMKIGDVMAKLDLERFKAMPFELPELAYQDFVCAVLHEMGAEIAELILESDLQNQRYLHYRDDVYKAFGGDESGI